MNGYVIARVAVHDEERYKDYVAHSAAALEPFGGRYLVRGGMTECVAEGVA
jgi:uncharacterized protein (DUF1330 family)